MNLSRSRHTFGLLLLLLVSMPVIAQEPLEEDFRAPIYIGIFGGYGAVTHDASIRPDFFRNSGTYASDKVFTKASGGGVIVGGLVEYNLSRNFSVGLRVGYNSLGFKEGGDLFNFNNATSGDLRQGANGPPVDGTVQVAVDADLAYLNATPHLKITPASIPVYAIGGLTILYPLSATYEFNESVVEPRGAVFATNNRATRRLGSGEISSAKTALGATLGIGIDYPLSRRLVLFGEAQYMLGFGDLVGQLRADERWKVSSLSGIIGIKFGLGGGPPPPPPPPVVRVDTALPARDSLFRAAAVTPDGFSDTLTITGRRVQGTEVHALLPYIFFPRDSSAIPDRYVQITRKERAAFSAEKLPRGNTLNVYYNILNVVGQRIRERRRPRNSEGRAGAGKLQIVGCVSNLENGDTALALRRAEAVRDYLRTVWAIPVARMAVSVSQGPNGLPVAPTTSEVDSIEGERENQRVELYYEENSAILEPVELLDTAFLMPAGVIRFFPPSVDTAKVAGWSLDVTVGDVLDKDFKSGFGPPPAEIDFPIAVTPATNYDQPVRVTGSFILRDTAFIEIGRSASEAVIVRQQGTFDEERNTVRGKYVDVFNLLLFHFDSTAMLAFSSEANMLMRDRIASSSEVTIVGHTDRIGLPPYNRELSQRRAEAASQALGVQVKNVLGMGEKKLLYDNTYPEGRYYSRTVTVTVETPVAAGDELRRRRQETDPNASGGTETPPAPEE